MRFRFYVLAGLATLVSSALAAQWPTFADRTGQSNVDVSTDLGTNYVEFTSRNLNDTKLRFVKNSGVCETTPGVNQLSGYIDVGTNMSMVRPPPTVSRARVQRRGLMGMGNWGNSGFGSSRHGTSPRLHRSRFGTPLLSSRLSCVRRGRVC